MFKCLPLVNLPLHVISVAAGCGASHCGAAPAQCSPAPRGGPAGAAPYHVAGRSGPPRRPAPRGCADHKAESTAPGRPAWDGPVTNRPLLLSL